MHAMRSLCALNASRWSAGHYLGPSLLPFTHSHVRNVVATRQKARRTQHAAAAAVAEAAPASNFISQWQPITFPEPLPLDSRPAAETINLLVVESFAGSYSAGRAARLLNLMPCSPGLPNVRISAYAAIELSADCYSRGPDSRALGISDPSRFLSINGSVTDAAVQGRVLNFVQRMLQQSEEAAAVAAAGTQQQQQQRQQQRIDGILFVGGPPCTFYSLANNGRAASIARDPELYKQQLFKSDQIVQAFMAMYSACKALAASSSLEAAETCSRIAENQQTGSQQAAPAAAAGRKPVATCIVMENPWSADLLRIRYPQAKRDKSMPRKLQPTATAAAGVVGAAAAVEDGNAGRVREHVHWSLRARRFLAHELENNGGPLAITHHNWCSYGHISHPWKSTAIFSDLPGLSDARCICNKCQPKDKRTGGRLKHLVTVDGQRDSSTRAVWPDGFMLRVVWLFGAALSG